MFKDINHANGAVFSNVIVNTFGKQGGLVRSSPSINPLMVAAPQRESLIISRQGVFTQSVVKAALFASLA
jgi:hypothetical protein